MALFIDIEKNLYGIKIPVNHLAKHLQLSGINYFHVEIHFFILCSYRIFFLPSDKIVNCKKQNMCFSLGKLSVNDIAYLFHPFQVQQ